MRLSEAVVWWRWGQVVQILRGLYIFQRNQGARTAPAGYYVAPDGSVRHKISKDARRVLKHIPEAERRFQEMRAALTRANQQLQRKDAALKDIHETILAGRGSFPVLIKKLKAAQA